MRQDKGTTHHRSQALWRLRHQCRLRGQALRTPSLPFGGLTRFLEGKRLISRLERIERPAPCPQALTALAA